MITLHCPVTHTVHGPLKSQADLVHAIAKSGQSFGVDESGPACNVIATAPCNQTYYEYLGLGLHKGIDIPVSTGTEVYAMADGKVSRVSDNITSGIGVVIYHPQFSIESVYWHLKSHSVFPGDEVKTGQLIGISDNTGYSEGPHLHAQINQTNEHGMSGQAIDPMPYFVWEETMSQEQVRNLYRLAFYREPTTDESTYWTGKNLTDFLKQALVDRSTFLSKP